MTLFLSGHKAAARAWDPSSDLGLPRFPGHFRVEVDAVLEL